MKNARAVITLLTLLALISIACGSFFPGNAFTIQVEANTSLKPWLDDAAQQFNKSATKTASGKAVQVVLSYVEAGQAVSNYLAGKPLPALWVPDAEVWADVLANKGNTAFQGQCQSTAQSPLVIAMWRPVAEALGWPGYGLGWLDIGSLAADQTAWAYYSGGQFGPKLRLGHTHPGLSNTGSDTMLAVIHAAQSNKDQLDPAQVKDPVVQASVGAFESAVAWFSSSTDGLGQAMHDRGISYLGAAVMYESTVVQYGEGDPGIIPIYPLEGTFMATHPGCINTSSDGETQEAARLFRDYLLSADGQKRAVASGLRPVNPEVKAAAPLDAAHGVDLSQPKIIYPAPTVDTLYAVQELWQGARKNVNLVMLVDTSGSMAGEKIDSVKQAAVQFVKQMGPDDYLTLVAFNTSANILVDHLKIADARDQAINAISGLRSGGNTILYDTIAQGADLIAATTSSSATNALVVLTDGKDTASVKYQFGQELVDKASANDTTVFTIAYGGDADENVLSQLALDAHGNFYKGDQASIADIYNDMSAAFGGSLGIGR